MARGQQDNNNNELAIVLLALGLVWVVWFVISSSPLGWLIRIRVSLIESAVLSFLPLEAFKKEYIFLSKLNSFLDMDTFKNVDREKLKELYYANYTWGRYTYNVIFTIIVVLVLYVMLRSEIRYIRRTHKKDKIDKDNDLTRYIGKGLDGYIGLMSRYLPDDVLQAVRQDPTPQKIYEAFAIARRKHNIPPNVAARCFKKYSAERNILLDYGRAKKIDIEAIT